MNNRNGVNKQNIHIHTHTHTHTHTHNTQRKIALKGLASMKISDTHFFKTTPPILPTPPLL